MKFCKVHHFADNTNLSCLSNSIKSVNNFGITKSIYTDKNNNKFKNKLVKKLNKLVNTDLKHIVNWLNEKKFTQHKKTEMVIFKSN